MKKAIRSAFLPMFICLFLSTCYLSIYLEASERTGSADLVLGQQSFTTNSNGHYPCSAAGLDSPTGLTDDGLGNIWVVDESNNRVLEYINPLTNGQPASAVLGQVDLNSNAYSGGLDINAYGQYTLLPPSQRGLWSPQYVAIDTKHNRIYVSDCGNNRVLWWNNGTISSNNPAAGVIGQPDFTSNSNANYPATISGLSAPVGVAVDNSGNVWVVDSGNNRVLKYNAPSTNGQAASLVLGQPDFTSCNSGSINNTMNWPFGIAVDVSSGVWVADIMNNRAMKFVNPSNNGQAANLVLGIPLPNSPQTGLHYPYDVAVDASNGVWVADSLYNRVLKFSNPISSTQTASIVLGQSNFTSNSPATTQTAMNFPIGLDIDPSGNVWVSDNSNNRVLKFNNTRVTDLRVVPWFVDNPIPDPVTAHSIQLTWTAPSDIIGKGYMYKIWYATSPITESSLLAGTTIFVIKSTSSAAEITETYTVTGLGQGTQYYFALKSGYQNGNYTDLSNVATATTLLDVNALYQKTPINPNPPIPPPTVHWATETFLDSPKGHTIGGVGCTLTCMAMIVNYYANYHPDSIMRKKITPLDPGQLNDLLIKNNWYDSDQKTLSVDVNFRYISNVTNNAVMLVKEKETKNDSTINEYLDQRREFPIIS